MSIAFFLGPRWRRRCLIGLIVACGLCGLAAAQQPGRAVRSASPELQALLAQPMGARPAEEMHWSQVLDALGRPADATRLREWLLDLWLRQQAGQTLPPPQTLEQVLAARSGAVKPGWGPDAQGLWQQAFNRQLSLRLPAAAPPLPGEIEVLRDQLADLGPGLWLLRDRAGNPRTLYAWVELVARGPQAFPATGFTLSLAGAPLECSLPRGQTPRLLAGGMAQGLLCARAIAATPGAALPTLALWTDAVARAAQAGALQPDALAREGLRLGLAEALAAPRQPERDAWLSQRRQAAESRTSVARAQSQAKVAADHRRVQLTDRVVLAAVALVTIVGFLLLARRFGPWPAAGVVWLVGMAVCVPLAWILFRAGRDAGGWGALGAGLAGLMVLAAPTATAVVLPVWYIFLTRLIGDSAFRRDLGLGLLAVTVVLLLQGLMWRFL